MKIISCVVVISTLVVAAPELTEINDQHLEADTSIFNPKQDDSEANLLVRIYRLVSDPFTRILRIPKVYQVLRNIGTCLVNGAMEIFSYYLPAPMMPLVASAAGLVIPFEPVVMLRERMPVASYRRAFQGAVNTFVGMFDKYKHEDEYDPYMTRRFNRRFMNNDKDKELQDI